jgi:hypothetical protein
MLIIILNHDTNQCDHHIDNLKSVFDKYPVYVTQDDYIDALKYAYKHYRNEQCLIIKDSSIVHFDVIPKITNLHIITDLIFLCSWQDECHKYSNVDNYDYLKYTYSTFASQAILYQPHIVGKMIKLLKNHNNIEDCLKTNIIGGTLSAVVFVPNIVHYDINLVTSNDHYNRLNVCAAIKTEIVTMKTANNAAWAILIVLFILLLVLLVPYFKHRGKF